MKSALALFEQARDTIVPILGPDHPQTLRILASLGGMYRAYRRTPEAIALLQHVRERRMLVLGGHHPATLDTLWDLGMAYLDAGEVGTALTLFEQAAVGVEKLEYAQDRANHIVDHLADCHERLKQYEQAEVWRRKWVAVARRKFGSESMLYATDQGLAGLGWNLILQTRYSDAEPFLRESVAILQKLEPNVWETFRTQSRLGGALLGQQKYAEAEPHLVQGYRGLKSLENERGTRLYGSTAGQDLREALERLVQLYDGWGKPEEAAKWRKELKAQAKAVEKADPPKTK